MMIPAVTNLNLRNFVMIEDVTNSPKDWEDFWYSPEKYGSWDSMFEESIASLSKRKLKLLSEIEEINLQIEHLRQQKESIHKVT